MSDTNTTQADENTNTAPSRTREVAAVVVTLAATVIIGMAANKVNSAASGWLGDKIRNTKKTQDTKTDEN
jgi:hypothetical protein